jgi:deoxyribose-phosphate aldolase
VRSSSIWPHIHPNLHNERLKPSTTWGIKSFPYCKNRFNLLRAFSNQNHRDPSGKGGVLDIAQTIDHSLLKPEVTEEEIKKLCEESKKYGFVSVCVNPVWVSLCLGLLKGSSIQGGSLPFRPEPSGRRQDKSVKICTVSGFPLGANKSEIKAKEAEIAIKDGADEIDMVANIGALRAGDFKLVEEDIKAVRNAIGNEKILKVIIETAVLTNQEKIKSTELIIACGADFVKTSTGFGYSGATVEDVKLLKKVVGDKIRIKASGGIRDYNTALELIEAGASRIGTSSGVQIVEQSKRAES